MADGYLSFDSVLRLYHQRVYNLVYRLISDPDDSADVTQEVFVKAYKAYPGFSGPSDAVYPWLCKIAVNSCKNRFKELGRKSRREVLSLDAGGVEGLGSSHEVEDESWNPAGVFERKEAAQAVTAAISALPPEFRLVVVLRDMQGLTYRQIADATGLSLDLVRVRLYRAREILRRRLGPYLNE